MYCWHIIKKEDASKNNGNVLQNCKLLFVISLFFCDFSLDLQWWLFEPKNISATNGFPTFLTAVFTYSFQSPGVSFSISLHYECYSRWWWKAIFSFIKRLYSGCHTNKCLIVLIVFSSIDQILVLVSINIILTIYYDNRLLVSIEQVNKPKPHDSKDN